MITGFSSGHGVPVVLCLGAGACVCDRCACGPYIDPFLCLHVAETTGCGANTHISGETATLRRIHQQPSTQRDAPRQVREPQQLAQQNEFDFCRVTLPRFVFMVRTISSVRIRTCHALRVQKVQPKTWLDTRTQAPAWICGQIHWHAVADLHSLNYTKL